MDCFFPPPPSAQYEVLRDFITPDIQQLVRARLMRGERLHDIHRRIHSFEVTKLVLLLVQIANPSEYFTEDEKNVMIKPFRAGAVEGGEKEGASIANREQRPANRAHGPANRAQGKKKKKAGVESVHARFSSSRSNG